MPTTISSVQDALDWVAAYHEVLAQKFFALYQQCTAPGFLGGGAALAAHRYAFGLGCWVRANDQWSFECHRYFGSKGPEVQVSRTVQLLPLGE